MTSNENITDKIDTNIINDINGLMKYINKTCESGFKQVYKVDDIEGNKRFYEKLGQALKRY